MAGTPDDGVDSWPVAVENLRAEARLEIFRRALDHSPDGLLVVDRETMTIIDANHTAVARVGISRADYIGSKVPNLRTDETTDRLAAMYDQAIAMAPQVQRQETTIQGFGRTYPVEITRRAIEIDGRWLLLICLRDITDKKRAEGEIARRMAELVRSNEELQRFAYAASHDLSEPLRMIGSFTQLLERRYKSKLDADGIEFMAFITEGVTRMKRLIDGLLTYSRAANGDRVSSSVDMNEVVADVVALLQAPIEDARAEVHADSLPLVPYDRTALTQLLQNLVANAIKFHRPGTAPLVSISADEEANHWRVTVRDNGIGIEPQYFERIFQLFQRLHDRAAFDGTGIGLSVCKKIVEHHGGRIWIESAPGEGSAFTFTVPKQGAAAAAG